MNNSSVIVIVSIMTLTLTGCSYFFKPSEPPFIQGGFTELEARSIAEKICIKGGESLAPGYYNENSKTWWFDANLNATQPGCNPACVVSEDTKTAEINWRCTGLVLPKESTHSGSADLPAPIVNNTSYQDVIDYVSAHITEIITAYSSKKPTNGKWFADGFGFTSVNHVYVDFEDGHYLFRALLECKDKDASLICTTLAIFEKQKQ